MASMAISDVGSTIGKYGRDFSPVTFATGFIFGATSDLTYTGGVTGGSILARTQDTIARVTGVQLDLKSGFGKTTQTRKLVVGNILNGAIYGALALEIAHSAISNKWIKVAKDVLQPPLWGYGIGKVFDDAISTSTALTQIGGSAYPVANYTNAARNGLPVSGKAPWTG